MQETRIKNNGRSAVSTASGEALLAAVLLAPIVLPIGLIVGGGFMMYTKNEERKKEERKRLNQIFEENKIRQQELDEKIAFEKKLLLIKKLEDEKNERINFLNNMKEDEFEINIASVDKKSEHNYIDDILEILEKLKEFDIELYELKRNQFNQLKNHTSQKAKLFLDDLKLEYGKIKSSYLWTEVYRESLNEFFQQLKTLNTNDLNIITDINKILQSQIINEITYDNIFERIQNEFEVQIEKAALASQVIASLEELNYVVISDKEELIAKLFNKEKIALPVVGQTYQVVVALNKKNTLLTRFVKTVSSQKDIENVSTSDKLQDKENLKKWCSLQETFQENLKKAGINTVQEIIEDEESDVLYIVDSSSNNSSTHQITKELRGL